MPMSSSITRRRPGPPMWVKRLGPCSSTRLPSLSSRATHSLCLSFPAITAHWLNRFTYNVLLFSRLALLSTVNRWRKDVLGLGKASPLRAVGTAKGRKSEQLCAVSPTVIPGYPADSSENIRTTGYWFLDEGENWHPDAALSAFLDDGDPPVYIGFGSMTTEDPARFAQTIVEGVRLSGVRAILATGWGAMEEIDAPKTMHVMRGAPHDALFEHVSAVVHHGGAGTTASGLRGWVAHASLPTNRRSAVLGTSRALPGLRPEAPALEEIEGGEFRGRADGVD